MISIGERWLPTSIGSPGVLNPSSTANSVLECFSVLTRLPPPHRLAPETNSLTISEAFSSAAAIVSVSRQAAMSALEETARLGLGGGQVYDAAIAACGAEAGAGILLTWNLKHFVRVAPPGLEIREP